MILCNSDAFPYWFYYLVVLLPVRIVLLSFLLLGRMVMFD